MSELIRARRVARGVWQLADVLDDRAYLVVGERRALLVDTMFGYGNLATVVEGLCDVPVEVALTHRHFDHVGGAFQFGRVLMGEGDMGHFDVELARGRQGYAGLVEAGVVDPALPWWPRDGHLPRVEPVGEGDVLDLGGVTVEAVALPGHTPGGMGYLVRERRILLSGDAVTPIMCLFFEECLGVDAWLRTISKMEDLPFDQFYTGHHRNGFSRESLAGFRACGESFESERPLPWQHAALPQYRGSLRIHAGTDAESEDFRAIITPDLPPRRARVHTDNG